MCLKECYLLAWGLASAAGAEVPISYSFTHTGASCSGLLCLFSNRLPCSLMSLGSLRLSSFFFSVLQTFSCEYIHSICQLRASQGRFASEGSHVASSHQRLGGLGCFTVLCTFSELILPFCWGFLSRLSDPHENMSSSSQHKEWQRLRSAGEGHLQLRPSSAVAGGRGAHNPVLSHTFLLCH